MNLSFYMYIYICSLMPREAMNKFSVAQGADRLEKGKRLADSTHLVRFRLPNPAMCYQSWSCTDALRTHACRGTPPIYKCYDCLHIASSIVAFARNVCVSYMPTCSQEIQESIATELVIPDPVKLVAPVDVPLPGEVTFEWQVFNDSSGEWALVPREYIEPMSRELAAFRRTSRRKKLLIEKASSDLQKAKYQKELDAIEATSSSLPVMDMMCVHT
jgi:hypothetical protein